MSNTSIIRVLRRGNDMEAFWELGQLITMGHPDLHVILEAFEEAINVAIDSLSLEVSMSILSGGTSNDIVGATLICNLLHPVADA